MFEINPYEKILVLSTRNETTELLAQALYEIDNIRDEVLRTLSSSKEDIINLELDKLPEYSVLYKIINDKQKVLQGKYYRALT